MAYQFAGFFARPVVAPPAILPTGAVWREIAAPFVGVGVSLPHLIGKSPAVAEVNELSRDLGLTAADCWIYLTYDCWGGNVDFVYGLGSRDGVVFGPVEESNLVAAETAFKGLMAQIGISAEDALRFEPFDRGYWCES